MRGPVYAHLAQLESYQWTGYRRHHLKAVALPPDLWAWCIALLAGALWGIAGFGFVVVPAAVALLACGAVLAVKAHRAQYKKPLVWTARVKRLVGAYAVIAALEVWAVARAYPPAALLIAGLPALNMAAAIILTKPMEAAIQLRYKRRAKRRLRQLRDLHQLKVVGITGSYGKTSTKHILGAILGARYDVLITPASYNTPMGICKTINDQLASHHQVFVAEMGARYKGDIRELVKLVEPDHSIITAVGPAHLDTMGSIEQIARTKFDLARGTAQGGVVVVNGDNEHCVREARTLGRPVLFYGLSGAPHLDAWAKDIRVDRSGTAFTLVLRGDAEIPCRTRLLGRHNVLNIVGAALLARRLGLTPDEIHTGIGRIEPVEHRLQLIDPGNGAIVIDDAFNANPEGAAQALEVLGQFQAYRKWLVTPGMVELGAASADIHRRFGEQMAKVCDVVILVGRLNAAAMAEGLRAAGFPEANLHFAKNLAEATSLMQQLGFGRGDVVLFENDLPDHLE
ncbi:Mur ligase [Alicyclobacillus cellulosilyticus]|uniref:Mur ligase n=1 Tax=Alicyclobacillus cellulosilyticus TaxID=1003997 RepID=A0A917K3K4_9BACL|nr:Mur ligase [Alicyclobacillus cellulosilyticus]